jgi:hypothetical protein
MLKLKELARRVYGGEDKALKLLLTVAVVCWLPRVFTPLWRDEVITWWIIKDGWGDALKRALAFQEWSTLYFLFIKAVTFTVKSETLLRLPSLAACAVCARAVYLISLRLKDARAGLISALVFCASGAALMYSNEARPYGLALALNALGVLYLIKTVDRNRPADAVLYALFTAAGAYMHLTTVLMLPAHALYWAWRRFIERDAAPLSGAALAGAAALMLPLAIPALSAFSRRDSLMFVEQPPFWKLLAYALPPDLVLGALGGLALYRPALLDKEGLARVPRSSFALALGLALLPLLFIFTVSHLFGVKIWVPRYFVCYELGVALAAGLVLSHVRSAAALKAAAIGLTFVSLAARTRLYHIGEDWAGAVAYAAAEPAARGATVLLTSPYVESLHHGWLGDASKTGYLSAPLSFYPYGARTVLLPFPYGADGDAGGEDALAGLAGSKSVVLFSFGDDNYNERLSKRLLLLGLRPLSRHEDRHLPRAAVYVRAALKTSL